MSLEKRFLELELDLSECPYNSMSENTANQCVQICDEEMVKFADWTCGRYIKLHSVWVGIYSDQRNKDNWKTTTELLEIYKQGL